VQARDYGRRCASGATLRPSAPPLACATGVVRGRLRVSSETRAEVIEAMVESHDWCYAIVRGAVAAGHEAFGLYWRGGGKPKRSERDDGSLPRPADAVCARAREGSRRPCRATAHASHGDRVVRQQRSRSSDLRDEGCRGGLRVLRLAVCTARRRSCTSSCRAGTVSSTRTPISVATRMASRLTSRACSPT